MSARKGVHTALSNTELAFVLRSFDALLKYQFPSTSAGAVNHVVSTHDLLTWYVLTTKSLSSLLLTAFNFSAGER